MTWPGASPQMDPRFENREEAGRVLARSLAEYADRPDVVVLGLPRGGIPVAFEVARSLGAPLDVFLVRKLGVPGQEELAMGALATGGVIVWNDAVLRELAMDRSDAAGIIARETRELERRERAYRGDQPPLDVSGKTVILVDDGLATGATMRAAAAALRREGPAKVIVAVPVASADTCQELGEEVDQIVCARTPEPFLAVGLWYRDFGQTTDGEVRALLERAQELRSARPGPPAAT